MLDVTRKPQVGGQPFSESSAPLRRAYVAPLLTRQRCRVRRLARSIPRMYHTATTTSLRSRKSRPKQVRYGAQRRRSFVAASRRPPLCPACVQRANDPHWPAVLPANAGLKAVGTCLDTMAPGWRPNLGQLRQWASTRTVTLRFEMSEACVFDRTEHREVESDTKIVTDKAGAL